MKTTNILVVDDHPISREGIEMILQSNDSVTIQTSLAKNGLEALKVYRQKRPDLIITDFRMPEMNGIELTRTVRKTDAKTPILMMSVLSNIRSITMALEVGINGYLTKLAATNEIQQAVNSLLSGKNYFSAEVTELLLNGFNSRSKASTTESLTKREMEILRFLSQDFSQEEIAKELFISPRTVEGHARNLRTKLKVKSSAGLIMSAIKQGLID